MLTVQKNILSVNSKILEVLLELRPNAIPGQNIPDGDRISRTGTKKTQTGRKNPEEELEMISTKLMIIPWTEPWHIDETRVSEIEALRIRPMKHFRDFCSRYVLRPQGPTKLLDNIIRFVLTDPKNQNFHLQSKRAYVSDSKTWEHIKTKKFYAEFREKMMVCYRKLVLAPHFHINGWAEPELAMCKIPHTNQHLEKILGELGPFPSWVAREKTRLR